LHGKIQEDDEKVDRLIAYNGNGLCEIPVGENCVIYYETTTKDDDENIIVTKYDISGRVTTTINGQSSVSGHNTLSLNYHYWYY
jgi:hypothetical protein